MTENGDRLARFHRTLIEEISARRPEYLSGPFTVAEIYQNLVPYGTHRDRLGVEMNGDYEDVLLRLLSGEGGYLILESEPALRVLRDEVDSSNPNTGLYREYAAVDVRLDPIRVEYALQGGTSSGKRHGSEARDEEPMSVDSLAPETQRGPALVVDGPADAAPQPARAPQPAASREAPDACRWCRAELPKRDDLNYCPFCGTDVHVVPCPGCGEELEPDWRFCVACGTEVGG